MHKRGNFILFSLFLLLLISIVIGVALGAVYIPFFKQMRMLAGKLPLIKADSDKLGEYIITQIRLPRVLLGALSGFALAFCGAIMQGVFRNPLADPYLLGVASGAGAGVACVIAFGVMWLPLALPAGSFIGALLAVGLVYVIAQRGGGYKSNHTLILAGVAIAALFSSLTTFLIFISKDEQLRYIVLWIMGSLSSPSWIALLYLSATVATASIVSLIFAEELDALTLGDEMASHLGVKPALLKKIFLGIATVLTAAVVCMVGTIGFVGLIVPHAVRLFTGAKHRLLLPASGLAGASFLVLCDTLARSIIGSNELPVGIITSAFGAPFFLFLLVRHRKNSAICLVGEG